jgi:hypothetical protein
MLVAAAGTAVAALTILAQPAMAVGVSNPGAFAATIQAGSSLTLSGGTAFGIGTPACSDGADNDLAGGTDFPADTSCASAVDANERLAGLQVYVAPRVNTTVAGSGAISLAAAGVVFPPGEVCTNTGLFGIWCLSATIVGDTAQVGTIDPEGPTAAVADGTISLNMDVSVLLDAVTGFPGLGANCSIQPANATVTSNNYNKSTGAATLTASGVAVPAVNNCGSFILNYNSLINGQLVLPGTASMNMLTLIRNAANQPVLP